MYKKIFKIAMIAAVAYSGMALSHADDKWPKRPVTIVVPYPGTPLYDRLAREGRHLYDGQWWLHPKYRFNSASFIPARMTPDVPSWALATGTSSEQRRVTTAARQRRLPR